jgi:type I restriction enzyme S subunit
MTCGATLYPVMQDSGVPWLGTVPAHWERRRLKSLLRPIDRRSSTGTETLLSLRRDHGIVVYSEHFSRPAQGATTVGYKIVNKGQLVVNRLQANNGLVFDSSLDGLVSPDYSVFESRDQVSMPYLSLLLRTATYRDHFRRESTGLGTGSAGFLRLYDDRFLDTPVVLPPAGEQAAILRFLDHADRRIRRYIRAKQKLIALLEEQKQAIIHRAVTRGLDPNVRLKPSGVEWLGDVPEHWGVCQLRRLISFVTSGSRGWANFYSERGDIFLQSGNLGRSMSLNLSFIQHVQPPQGAEGERTKVSRDDVLVCITGALTGNVALVDVDLPAPAFVNQHVALVRPNRTKVYPRYLAFALYSEIGRAQFKTMEYGGTKQGLGLDDVRAAVVLLPPVSEQIQLCTDLDAKLAALVTAIDVTEREISLVREYRTRLIADVVTGKLDVREAAARLPKEVEEPEPLDGTDALTDADEDAADDLSAVPEEAEV